MYPWSAKWANQALLPIIDKFCIGPNNILLNLPKNVVCTMNMWTYCRAFSVCDPSMSPHWEFNCLDKNNTRVHMFFWMRHCIIQNCDTNHEGEICSSARHFMGFVMKSINYKTIRMLSAVHLHDFFWTVQASRISEGWRTEVRNVAQETRKCNKAEDVNERFPVNCGSLSLITSCCFQTIVLLMKIITGLEEYPVAMLK